jgi:hypothetical protein
MRRPDRGRPARSEADRAHLHRLRLGALTDGPVVPGDADVLGRVTEVYFLAFSLSGPQ